MACSNKLLYFSLGVGAGVVTGLLLAPQEGSQTRDLLAGKANDAGDYLKTRAREGSDYLAEKSERGRNIVKESAKFAGDYVNKAKSTVKGAAAESADQMGDTAHSVGNKLQDKATKLRNS